MSFVTFGEIMLRLTPSDHAGKLWDAKSFAVNFAGSESNVASSLALLGNEVSFISKVPANHLGRAVVRSLNSYGVNTALIGYGGKRLGTYFIELGSSIRPSEVIYDRAGSAISEIAEGEFEWEKILAGKSWVFISGITPALSDRCAEETIALVSTAKKLDVKVCFDFNFRRSLWQKKEKARQLFSTILEHTTLLCGNYGSLSDVYDIEFNEGTETANTLKAIEYAENEFGVTGIAFTVREHHSATKNTLSAILRTGSENYFAERFTVDIADRFGTGDAFAAAFLHALERNWNPQKVIDFAAAAFALKHTIKGDQHTSNENEITSVMKGNVMGHVIR